MDTIVQTLNTAGRAFVHFALPMLLQSSLLILLLLAVDVLLRRRVRAVFRYWIWTLVLIKLVLPPSLWSPVSIGTWVGDELEVSTAALLEPAPAPPAKAPVAARPSPAAYILSSPDPVFAADPEPRPVEMTLPPAPVAKAEPVVTKPAGPTLTWQGFVLLPWGMTVVALLLLLLQRAYFVQGLVAQAAPADRKMFDVLEECRAHLGLRCRVALRISPNATSPAVCGLRRTTVLIPQSLAPRLQGRDLRAVFLHELAHVRRGDLWVNFAQTLLQVAYFYHPLLWLANAVMRRAREQAVDETVLVAMGETAPQYPETLVNVAKLALRRRPVLSLRLVGVVESKSALSARVRHMLTRPLPRTAKLGALGLTTIAFLAAVLLPMARGKDHVPLLPAGQGISRDTDGDGLPDFQEVHKYLTDPTKKDSDGDGTPDGDWSERREYAYSVRTVLRYLPPFDEKGLNDDFQDARVLQQSAEYVEIEVIHYPLATGYDAIPENPNWRQDNARDTRLAEYLAPGATANWDEQMRKDLLTALKADSIDVETLTDKQAVERVSSWLMRRSRSLDNVFTTYYVDFPQGTPRVYPGLEDAFRREFERDSRHYDWPIEKHFDHELLGKGMFYNKTHGSCTSTAVYLTTVLRALGIPTRMVLATPLVDASDRAQVLMVKDAITHHRVRLTVMAGLGWSTHGWVNHTFNEVYVGNRWCRLDYSQLGCPAFGPSRFGLQTHLYTFNDLSDIDFAPTWGRRYAKGEHSDAFQHDNPYSAVEVSELFGPHGNIPNPPCTAQDIRSHPKPDIYLYYPSRADVWQGFLDVVAGGTANKTGRPHQKEFYDNLFEGIWLTRPQDILVLLFALDAPERVPAGYEDLLPRPWAEIESSLKQGETVELSGRARDMNVILLAAPTGDGLETLVPNSRLLRAIGGAGPVPSVAATSPTVVPSSVTSARLPDGVTLELLGACEYPSAGKQWWRPDGSALAAAPYRTANNKRERKEGSRDYELVVRYGGAPDMDIQWDVPGSASTGTTGNPYDADGKSIPDLTVCTVRFPQAQTATDVRVATAAGAWETRATHTALEREGTYTLEDGKAVAFGIPYTRDGVTFVPVTTDFPSGDMAFRVVAMQGQNEAHSGGMSGFGDKLNSLTYRFKCPLSEIRELRFQTRPWTWVEFRNVALRPGLKTEAQVEVLSAARASRPARRPPGEEEVFGLGPAWEVLKAAVGDHYGGTIGGFGSDATQRKQYFDRIFSLAHAGDIFVLMFAFDQPVGVPPEYADLLPLPWAQIESRVRAGESFEAHGQSRDVTVIVLAAPTSAQLDTLVRQTHLLDAFRSSPSQPAQSSQEPVSGQRRVVLPEVDKQPVILDLATGELVPLPLVGSEPAKLQEALRKLGKGDLLYDQDLGDHTLILLRDATSPQAREDTGEASMRGYLIGQHLPEVLTVTTGEGRRYEVQVLAADDKACTLIYSPMARNESVGGNASTSPGKGGAAAYPSAGAGPGPLGRHALSFDGVGDKLVVPPSASLTLKPPFFIEVWAKPDFSMLSEPRPGHGPRADEPLPEMSLIRQGGELRAADSSSREPASSDADGWPVSHPSFAYGLNNIQSGGFMGFLLRRSGGLFAVRKDGRVMQANIFRANELPSGRSGWSHYYSLCTRDYLPEDYVPAMAPLVIGGRIVPNGFAFKGEIAELRLWNKVLTAEEMQRYEAVSLTGNEPNLVACWDFERQAGGQVVYDITANHNDARLGDSTGTDAADPRWVSIQVADDLRPQAARSTAPSPAQQTQTEDPGLRKQAASGGTSATAAGAGDSLSGIVMDESGRPLNNVRVSNWYPHGSMPQETTTDARGRFSFENKRGYVVKAERAGLAPEFCEFKEQYFGASAGKSLQVVLTMTEGGVVAGSVLSQDHRAPIPGAQVWLELEGKDTDVGINRYVLWRTDVQRTDDKGHFEFRRVPDGMLRVGADANGFVEGATEYLYLDDKGSKQVDLALRPKTVEELQQDRILAEARRDLSLSGTVTDEGGRPVEAVEISNWFPGSSNPQQTYTDARGRYHFAEHRGYVIAAKKPSFASVFHEFKDEYFTKYEPPGNWRTGRDRRGPVVVDLTLTRGATLTGTVLSSRDGTPVAGARVHLERQAKDTDVGVNEYAIWTSDVTNTDSRGRFAFEHVPSGIVRVLVNRVQREQLSIEGSTARQVEVRVGTGSTGERPPARAPATGTQTETPAGDKPSGPPDETLKRLLADARPGSTVTVPKGRYTTPIEISRPVVLRGESQEGCVIEVTADQPAVLVNTGGQGEVTIENVTVRWQLATEKPSAQPAALRVKDTNARIRNCRFLPLGDPKRTPTAVYIEGRSNSTVDNCRFRGFEYTVCYGQGTEGVVQDCIITDCGHQGVINYEGATLTVQRCIITGSKFHAVRCTGGTLDVKDSLLIKNANRGIYLGNKTGRGTITNNVILGNGSGISGFGRAGYAITNNVVMGNQYAGIDMRDSCRFSIRNNVLAKNQRGLMLFKEGTANANMIGKNTFWSNATDVDNLDKPADSLTADPQFAAANRGDFTVRGSARDEGQGLTNPRVIRQLWAKYEQLQQEQPVQPTAQTGPVSPAAQPARQSSTPLAWQRTDAYVPPDPDGFFPDDPDGGKKLDVLFQAMDKDSRSDEEILSTVRQGFRRTTQHRTLILQWVGNKYIWGKDPQNAQAIEIMYHAVSLERHYAVYFGLSVTKDKTPNILHTLADICLQGDGQTVGRITWGVGSQREQLLSYITPHLQDSDAARREIAGALVKHFRGELDFEQWQRDWHLEQVKAQFGSQLPQFKETLRTGASEARYEVFTTILRNQMGPLLDDSFLPALEAAAADPDQRVRNEVARVAGGRWVWSAGKQDPNAIAHHPRLRAGEIRPVPISMQLYLEEMHGVTPPGTPGTPSKPSADAETSVPSPAPVPGPGPIQQRINEAAPGATVRLEPGLYRESLLINKPLTLEGAGWDKTVIVKETMAVKAPEDIERLMAERVAAASSEAQRQEIMAQMKKEFTEKLSPLVLTVENARDVVIRGIKFTAPGGTIKGGSINVPLLKFDHSCVQLADCAVIAGPGDGIHILNGSGAQIEKTLVAAVWGTGIMVGPGPSESGVRIHDCDIRNCHYAGMGIRKGASNTVVERCRIWGAAWHGIRYDDASPQILGNLLFRHARFGIYASGQTVATVRGNLFYANEMTGMACWFQNKDQIEGNTFVGNKEANLAILGAAKPDIRRNIFYGGPVGVLLGNVGAESPFAKSEGTVALQDNLFWLADRELQLRRDANTTEILAIGADTGTVRIDPGFTAAAAKDFSLRADSPARAKNIGAGDLLPFDSPWPLQPEELAIIPTGDTRDSRQWRQSH